MLACKRSLLIRGGRKTPNPWVYVTKQYDKYGKYANLFDDKTDSKKYYDKRDMSKSVMQHFGLLNYPSFGISSFVAPGTFISGHVEVWQFSTIWYGCTIRADTKLVRIGAYSTIEDNCVITEATKPLLDEPDHDGSTIIGPYVTVGYGSKLEACTVEPYCLIGAKSILMPGSYMEESAQLLPASVLHGRVPTGELWGGNPAKFVRNLTQFEKMEVYKESTQHALAEVHRDEFYLPSIAHVVLGLDRHEVTWEKPGFGVNEWNNIYNIPAIMEAHNAKDIENEKKHM